MASAVPNFPIVPAGGSGQLKVEPTITIPAGPVPSKLEVKDLITGTGAVAAPHDNVTVDYLGFSYLNCSEFDSSWSRNETATFSLDGVIPGFALGIGGDTASGISPMKVGGRREIIVPSADGYGAQGSPPKITSNEEIVFVVDLLSESPAS